MALDIANVIVATNAELISVESKIREHNARANELKSRLAVLRAVMSEHRAEDTTEPLPFSVETPYAGMTPSEAVSAVFRANPKAWMTSGEVGRKLIEGGFAEPENRNSFFASMSVTCKRLTTKGLLTLNQEGPTKRFRLNP